MTHDVEIIHETQLNAKDDRAIAALLKAAFTTNFYNRSYFQQRHHLRLLIREGNRVAAHIGFCLRDVRLGDAVLTVMGVGDVASAPDLRGQGLASCLLKRAIDEARAGPAQFMVLFGDRAMYVGHGFVAQPNMLRFVTLEDGYTGGIKTEPDETLMVLPLRDNEWDAKAPHDLMGHKF